MTVYATQDMIADALIHGHTCQLQPRPPQVVIGDDDTVTLDPGTRLVRAPLTHTARRGSWRKWPRDESDRCVICEDGDYVELRARPQDSLFGLMAESNCAHANALGKAQLIAVWYCVMQRPFPLGDGQWLYERALEVVESDALARATAALTGRPAKTELATDLWDAADKMSVGEIRRTLVVKAGSGCNAPTDSYLRLAAQLAQGLPVTGY
jgi:hypothetical protein